MRMCGGIQLSEPISDDKLLRQHVFSNKMHQDDGTGYFIHLMKTGNLPGHISDHCMCLQLL